MLAVGRDTYAAQARAPVRQPNVGHGVAGRVNRADVARHVVPVRRIQRQVIGHQDHLAVGRDGRSDRLADHRHPGHFLLGRKVDHRNVIVEPVADIQPLSVRRDRWGGGGVTCRDGQRDPPGRNVDQANGPLRRGTGDVERGAVGTEHQARRRGRAVDGSGDFAACHVHDGNLLSILVQNEQALAVLRGDHVTRSEVSTRLGGRRAGDQQAYRKSTSRLPKRARHWATPLV